VAKLTRLFVNVDHVATVREARKIDQPDPLKAALMAEQAGACGVTVHLREDRRHIQDHDVRRIRREIKTPLNLEMAAVPGMVEFALEIKPYQVSLVPEKREEITTEGGLNVLDSIEPLADVKARLKSQGIEFSLFLDPDPRQIEAAVKIGADRLELNTGLYSEQSDPDSVSHELEKIASAARFAAQHGFKVFAGHGLNLHNVGAIARIPEIEELNIGHSLVSRAIFCGLPEAVREMIQAIEYVD
jgi:pyridoxine 5-phosphate synthase